jgi:hypothetical protein
MSSYPAGMYESKEASVYRQEEIEALLIPEEIEQAKIEGKSRYRDALKKMVADREYDVCRRTAMAEIELKRAKEQV